MFEFTSFVYPAILLLKDLYQTPIPGKFLRDISPNLSKRIIARIIAKTVNPFSRRGRAFEGSEKALFVLSLSPKGLKDKLEVLISRKTLGYFFRVIKFLFSKTFMNSSKSARAIFGVT